MRGTMHHVDDLLRDLTRVVLADRALEEVLTEITEIAARGIPGAESVSTTLMRGEKPLGIKGEKTTLEKDWAWAYPTYTLKVENGKKIARVEIDASQTMADINRENNTYTVK